MCEYLDRVENRGIQKGIQKGIQMGRQEGIEIAKKELAITFHENGVSVEVIAKATNMPIEVIEEWLGLVSA